jgi:Xaa-Pro aminopeptidase
MFQSEIYKQRRQKLAKLLKKGLVLIAGNTELPINYKSNVYPFRQDANMLYFTGINKPNCWLIIDIEANNEILFVPKPEADHEIWCGKSDSIDDYRQKSGISQIKTVNELSAFLHNKPFLFTPIYNHEVLLQLSRYSNKTTLQLESDYSDSLIKAVVSLRSIKEKYEVEAIMHEINVAAQMHAAASQLACEGETEQAIYARITEICLQQGSRLAFNPIITINGHILHNPNYINSLKSGQLLLVDAGSESTEGYASDITRTTPVNQKFSTEQAEIYNIVLYANQQAIALCKAGIAFAEVHKQAALNIAQGLKAIGIMKGNMNEAVDQGAHALFFPHGIGHMLGLDVHDMEALGEDYVGYNQTFVRSKQFGLSNLRLAKPLEAGNVVTIEPGIYFIPALIEQWKHNRICNQYINYNILDKYLNFGGIRIEDNVMVTASGSENLSAQIDKIKSLQNL